MGRGKNRDWKEVEKGGPGDGRKGGGEKKRPIGKVERRKRRGGRRTARKEKGRKGARLERRRGGKKHDC